MRIRILAAGFFQTMQVLWQRSELPMQTRHFRSRTGLPGRSSLPVWRMVHSIEMTESFYFNFFSNQGSEAAYGSDKILRPWPGYRYKYYDSWLACLSLLFNTLDSVLFVSSSSSLIGNRIAAPPAMRIVSRIVLVPVESVWTTGSFVNAKLASHGNQDNSRKNLIFSCRRDNDCQEHAVKTDT